MKKAEFFLLKLKASLKLSRNFSTSGSLSDQSLLFSLCNGASSEPFMSNKNEENISPSAFPMLFSWIISSLPNEDHTGLLYYQIILNNSNVTIFLISSAIWFSQFSISASSLTNPAMCKDFTIVEVLVNFLRLHWNKQVASYIVTESPIL